jgi:3-keto-5-aminohexanoate cleavage enzyme
MQEVVQGIRENTHLLLNLSTGVYPEAPAEMRRRPIEHHTPELASLNPGTMNFCMVGHRDGKIIYDFTYPNPFHLTLDFAKLMKEKGIKPEMEVFDIGHVHNVIFLDKHYDLAEKPLHFSFVFGVMGGVPFDLDVFNGFLHAIPPGSTWQGIGVGPFQYPVAMLCASLGGHIRVGLEDSLFSDYSTKTLARGSWEQVEKAVQIARLAGREVATPDEARMILNLPEKPPAAGPAKE